MFIEFPFGRQKIILNSDHIVSILWDEKFGGLKSLLVTVNLKILQFQKLNLRNYRKN